MSPTGVVAHMQVLRMSWEEYLALPDGPKAEWVAGEVVVSPPVSPGHGEAVGNVLHRWRAALPSLVAYTEVGLRMAGDRLRSPDLMLVEHRPTGGEVVEPPIVVGEVLSPSTRVEDLVRKAAEYAAAGIGQYWVVDPEARTLLVFENVDGEWHMLLKLDDARPAGEVEVAPHGTVELDLAEILPPR